MYPEKIRFLHLFSMFIMVSWLMLLYYRQSTKKNASPAQLFDISVLVYFDSSFYILPSVIIMVVAQNLGIEVRAYLEDDSDRRGLKC